ncbi:putative Ig domain-containing protein [Pseudomonas sp. LT1P18]|uniref:putative Ig domain-containing protein n=1 Tax=Pseudomonas arabinosi TaxID=3398357 RepID=UPI0039EF6876
MKRALFSIIALSLLLGGCELTTLAGCAGRAPLEIQPDSLASATTGKAYNVSVEVKRTNVAVAGFYVDPAQPLPEGLKLVYEEGQNHARIVGTPTKPGRYEVSIYLNTYGTQCTGQAAQRTYTLNVESD